MKVASVTVTGSPRTRVRAIHSAGVVPACARKFRLSVRTLIAALRARAGIDKSSQRFCSIQIISRPMDVPSLVGGS